MIFGLPYRSASFTGAEAAARAASRPDAAIETLAMDVNELTFDTALFDAVAGFFILMARPDPAPPVLTENVFESSIVAGLRTLISPTV